MIVEVKYFGKLIEVTGCQNEKLELAAGDLTHLKQVVFQKHPALEKEEFTVAVNKNIVNDNCAIEPNYEIALLPPFAGG